MTSPDPRDEAVAHLEKAASLLMMHDYVTTARQVLEIRKLLSAAKPPAIGVDAVAVIEQIKPSTFYRQKEVGDLHGWCERTRGALRSALSPAATSGSEAGGGPTYVVNCCNCGRIIDTREEDAGGDGWGHELSDERWVCSPECLDAVSGEPASSPAGGDVRDGALGWNSPEEWEIEQRAFHAAGRDDVPKDVQELVAILWKQYCIAAEPIAALSPSTSAAEPVAFQQRVQPWMMACFGAEISADVAERNHRFLEEALELVQSTGCTASEAHQLVDYVYGRDIGETHQEIGGVMVTLAALCLALSQDMHAAGETELARIWTKVEKIRAKQAAKPKHSPLPQHVATPPAPAAVDGQRVKALDEIENLVNEYAPKNSDWYFRRTVIREVLSRIRACLATDKEGSDV